MPVMITNERLRQLAKADDVGMEIRALAEEVLRSRKFILENTSEGTKHLCARYNGESNCKVCGWDISRIRYIPEGK